MTIKEEIEQLKKEKDAVILAHYYVRPEIQEIADYIGDSFYLSKVAVGLKEKTIVFCGVSFMGESAKILNPEKTVLMPDMAADCPMAHMASPETIEKVRAEYDDLAVVCYINSTAELKRHSDVCVTSANAVKIVKNLPNKNIFFIPDRNLAHYIAGLVPEKHFIYNEGFCIVHEYMEVEEIRDAKKAHPDAEVLAHPECPQAVLELADYIGVNRSYLTSSFKKAIGCSPQEYLVNLRMEKAREMLRNTGMQINAVAAAVGYQDQLAFSKIFKQHFGTSPKAYREMGEELQLVSEKGKYTTKKT